MDSKNNTFSRVGLVLAAAGSAVGLGNIWKFPYMTGQNGGAAFLLVYLFCVLILGIPLMCTEFFMGRNGLRRWTWMRVLSIFSSTIFFAFYLVITGWCFEYLLLSLSGALSGLSTDDLTATFSAFCSMHWKPVLWAFVGIVLTALIELAGVKKGIEKVSNILMPLLLLMLLVIIVYGLTLPGSSRGLLFLFQPDFSKITPSLVLRAMGQCFFSLSIGVGCLATYASYMHEKQNLLRTAVQVISLDTLVAVLAGMAIFPAVFALGVSPAEGPELVFITLPSVFSQMPAGYWLQIAFFFLLGIAALTSTISLMEVEVHSLNQVLHLSRPQAVALASFSVLLLGVSAILSKSMFALMDQLVSLYLLPFGGFLFAIYVGWICPKEQVENGLTPSGHSPRIGQVLRLMIRYFIPLIIILIFLQGLNIL